MCNAWNHPPKCNCGWGGSSHSNSIEFSGQRSHSNSVLSPSLAAIAVGKQPKVIRQAETYTTNCWWCGVKIYYHTNGYGDSVLFDSLGCPWQIHSCWIDYWEGQKSLLTGLNSSSLTPVIFRRIEQYENSDIFSVYKSLTEKRADNTKIEQCMAILAGVLRQSRFIPDEFSVAYRMGISLNELRKTYGDYYTINPSTNGIKLKTIKQINEINAYRKPEILIIKKSNKN